MSCDPAAEAEYLDAELRRLDLLLHREILRLRAAYQLSLDEFRGLYVSDEQVDALVATQLRAEDGYIDELTERAERLRCHNTARRPAGSPWTRLVAEFGLTERELDVLLLALAPEVSLKYETLYAYLNNDVSRKWPTIDLALRLLASTPAERLRHRALLAPAATLVREGLIQPAAPQRDRPSGLASPLLLAPPVADFLLGAPARHPDLLDCAEWRTPTTSWEALAVPREAGACLRRAPQLFAAGQGPVLVLEASPGAGRSRAAAAISRTLGVDLLRVDLRRLLAREEPSERWLARLRLQQRLGRAVLYLAPADAWLDDEGRPTPDGLALAGGLDRVPGPVLLGGRPGTPWRVLLQGVRHVVFAWGALEADERRRIWAMGLASGGMTPDEATLDALADRFVLTPGQIAAALQAAQDLQVLRADDRTCTFSALAEAARTQTDGGLARLAQRVRLVHTWDELVLPGPTLRQLREVTAAIRYHSVVYTQWGFGQRAPAGQGLKVLFAGASGTGKTMAAGVMAHDLGLDLYKIDLAGVVSKYIGETEKNLDRIFRAARTSQAILFFDEADALFGKRSEVKDAHDRYANIEVSYLLQKLEEHDGAVILASNLSKNIDDAFARRMHYVVDFPLPDESLRLRLWQGMFAPEAPLSTDVDFPFLAKQFPIAGGDIRNVALDAAFLAAQDGRVIGMRHLVRAMGRQLVKRGKSPQVSDFKEYYALLG